MRAGKHVSYLKGRGVDAHGKQASGGAGKAPTVRLTARRRTKRLCKEASDRRAYLGGARTDSNVSGGCPGGSFLRGRSAGPQRGCQAARVPGVAFPLGNQQGAWHGCQAA
mmetsp:Transcript_18963/g.56516  ORF Transcript_18963/g.56516 Transcript_18963/m.56516 type:complete len:110 (-) Transcript_18963:922-1251(-)